MVIAERQFGGVMGLTADIEDEFEARLVESSTLAFRVAYGVLRHRQDAEDVAQEAFIKAYRGFRQLRDRERFRAWLVRTAIRPCTPFSYVLLPSCALPSTAAR